MKLAPISTAVMTTMTASTVNVMIIGVRLPLTGPVLGSFRPPDVADIDPSTGGVSPSEAVLGLGSWLLLTLPALPLKARRKPQRRARQARSSPGPATAARRPGPTETRWVSTW